MERVLVQRTELNYLLMKANRPTFRVERHTTDLHLRWNTGAEQEGVERPLTLIMVLQFSSSLDTCNFDTLYKVILCFVSFNETIILIIIVN